MITKNIIQTYESELNDLPQEAYDCIQKWKFLNPGWNYLYFSENDRLKFVKDNFGKEWLNLYKKLPLGIMKANVFKYMSLFIYGGLYADLDHLPNVSIESWLDLNKKFVLVGDEEDPSFIFSIAVFASEPNSNILKSILSIVKKNIKNNNFSNIDKYSVLQMTGEIPFSEGKIIDPQKQINVNQGHEYYNKTEIANKIGFYCFGGKDWDIFRGKAVTNLDAANNWKNKYKSWWEEAK
jgi:mannosyltransferase OCH1-like enzyme